MEILEVMTQAVVKEGEPATSRFALQKALASDTAMREALAVALTRASEVCTGAEKRRAGRAVLAIIAAAFADAEVFEGGVVGAVRELHFAADALARDVTSGALPGLLPEVAEEPEGEVVPLFKMKAGVA